MALSRIVAIGDGATRTFAVNFTLGYLNPDDVTCRVGDEADGAGNTIYRTITWLSPTLAEISGTIPASGERVLFERTVTRDELLVDYENNDIINEDNLNTMQKQMIMLVHEVMDGRFTEFVTDFDMGGFRITNLGEPVDPTDAVTKQYADQTVDDAEAYAVAAANSAYAAANSASNASIAAGNAALYRDQAQSARTAAGTSELNAAASELAAAGSALAASGSAGAAAGSANVAEIAKGDAEDARDLASGYAVAASNSAGLAYADRIQTGLDRTQTGLDAASTDADRTQTGLDRTATGADRIQTGLDAAAASSALSKAQEWATKPEDQPVEPGLFSAFHWAAKAATLVTGGIAAAIHGASSKAIPDDADELALIDSADGWSMKKLTWANLKTALSSVFLPKSGGTMTGDLDMGGKKVNNADVSDLVGTTAGTLAAGNDNRLSDSREWTAGTVSQSEAQAGTATTRRAWTAQRVRQAIEALAPVGLYTGGSASATDFPVGHIVAANGRGEDRNAVTVVRLSKTNSRIYDTSGSGDVLSGTWRSRGRIGTVACLVQRVA